MCKSYLPFAHATSIYDIEISFFLKYDIKYVFADLDNTLDSYRLYTPSKRAFDFVKKLNENNIKVMIISNNKGKRVSSYASHLGVEFMHSSGKPFSFKIKKLLKEKEINPKNVMMIGDQMVTDIKAANGAKVKSILTDKLVKEDQWTTRFNRIIERPFRKLAMKKGKLVDWRNK